MQVSSKQETLTEWVYILQFWEPIKDRLELFTERLLSELDLASVKA